MKTKLIPIVFLALLIACSKEKGSALRSSSSNNSVTVLDTAKIPLNDLGTGTYLGSMGGLYPGGVNTASGVYADDLFATSQTIVPLDTFGLPSSSSKAKIAFISLGASTGGHNMTLLRTKTVGNPLTNAKLNLMNCNNGTGDASLNSLMDTTARYWSHVTQIIKGHKSSYRQVQVIYVETDDSSKYTKWPQRPTVVKNDLETCLRVFKKRFPNVKVVYVLGRARTFGNNAPWNKEPSPYYFGWGCKWAIEDQINGVPGTEYKGANPVAPMLAWGWYQWADVTPRTTDGFYWLESETADGLHANPAGQDTLTTHFQNFLLTDPNTNLWYAAH